MNLKNFFESSLNNEKLKEARLKKNLLLKDAAAKLDITPSTLSKYENGTIKSIPMSTLKKMGELYNYDYRYFFGWEKMTFFSTITGFILSSFYLFSPLSIFNGATIGGLLGLLGFESLSKYYVRSLSKDANMVNNFYEQLTEEEKEEFAAFKTMNYAFLKSKQLFSKDELLKDEGIFLSIYFAHKIRRENKIIDINEEGDKEVKKDE